MRIMHVDVANYGDERSVISFWQDRTEMIPLRPVTLPGATPIGEIVSTAKLMFDSAYLKPLAICVDTTGIGAAVADALADGGAYPVLERRPIVPSKKGERT